MALHVFIRACMYVDRQLPYLPYLCQAQGGGIVRDPWGHTLGWVCQGRIQAPRSPSGALQKCNTPVSSRERLMKIYTNLYNHSSHLPKLPTDVVICLVLGLRDSHLEGHTCRRDRKRGLHAQAPALPLNISAKTGFCFPISKMRSVFLKLLSPEALR